LEEHNSVYPGSSGLLERLGKFLGKEGSIVYSVWEGISWQAAVEKC